MGLLLARNLSVTHFLLFLWPFDSPPSGMQRFGTSMVSTHQVGIPVFKGQFEEACKLLLSPAQAGGDLSEVEEAKEFFAKGELDKALQVLPRNRVGERAILQTLEKMKSDVKTDWKAAFQSVSSVDRVHDMTKALPELSSSYLKRTSPSSLRFRKLFVPCTSMPISLIYGIEWSQLVSNVSVQKRQSLVTTFLWIRLTKTLKETKW